MTADPMPRAREMLAAEYARNEMDGEAAYLREGSTASLDEQCAVNVIAALLTREAEVRGEERKRAVRIAEAKIAEFADAENAGNDDIEEAWHNGMAHAAQIIATAIRDGAPGGDGWKCATLSYQGQEPQDCDWPYCGCDPKATEVLTALDEHGYDLVDRHAKAALPEKEEVARAIYIHMRLHGDERGSREHLAAVFGKNRRRDYQRQGDSSRRAAEDILAMLPAPPAIRGDGMGEG